MWKFSGKNVCFTDHSPFYRLRTYYVTICSWKLQGCFNWHDLLVLLGIKKLNLLNSRWETLLWTKNRSKDLHKIFEKSKRVTLLILIKGSAQCIFLCNPKKSGASRMCIIFLQTTQKTQWSWVQIPLRPTFYSYF